ncbi:hypothetical protein EBT31_06505 [bacterium]|nr:hypothetical protein [bacterium]
MDEIKVAAALGLLQALVEKALSLVEKGMTINGELEMALVAAGPEGLRTLLELRRLQADTTLTLAKSLGEDLKYAVEAGLEISRDAARDAAESRRQHKRDMREMDTIGSLKVDVASLQREIARQRDDDTRRAAEIRSQMAKEDAEYKEWKRTMKARQEKAFGPGFTSSLRVDSDEQKA